MSNEEIVRRAYARYNERDFDIVDDTFAADIDWKLPGLVELTGSAQVREFFEGLAEQFESHTIAMTDFIDAGDRFVAYVTHTFTRPDGESADVFAVHTWGVENGTLTSLYEIADSLAFAVISGQISVPA